MVGTVTLDTTVKPWAKEDGAHRVALEPSGAVDIKGM